VCFSQILSKLVEAKASTDKNQFAKALQILLNNSGEILLKDLKQSVEVKTIYALVANCLVKIDRTQVDNRVILLI